MERGATTPHGVKKVKEKNLLKSWGATSITKSRKPVLDKGHKLPGKTQRLEELRLVKYLSKKKRE